MALKDLQDKLSALAKEGDDLAAKPNLAATDLDRLVVVTQEATDTQSQIKALTGWGSASEWARQSAGRPQLVGTKQDGDVTVDNKPDSVLVGSDGAFLIDERKAAVIRNPAYKAAFRPYLKGDTEALKVLQEGLDVSGGYLVPEDIQNRVLQKEPAPTMLSGRVTRLTTSRDAMVFPKITYTTDNLYTTPMRVTWTGEIPASSTAHRVTEPTFGQVRIPIYTAMMSLPVSRDMIEDTAFDIMGWIADKFRETIDLLQENLILNGSGAGQAEGILLNSAARTNAVNSGAAANVTGDGIIDLAFNLPPQYDRNAVFVMNKLVTAREIFQLKDGVGRYLWANQAEAGGLMVPKIRSDLLGSPVLYSEFMPNCTTASNYALIYGDVAGYYLVNRIGFSIEVHRDSAYAEVNQVLVLGRVRFGGMLVEDWRLRLQLISA